MKVTISSFEEIEKLRSATNGYNGSIDVTSDIVLGSKATINAPRGKATIWETSDKSLIYKAADRSVFQDQSDERIKFVQGSTVMLVAPEQIKIGGKTFFVLSTDDFYRVGRSRISTQHIFVVANPFETK